MGYSTANQSESAEYELAPAPPPPDASALPRVLSYALTAPAAPARAADVIEGAPFRNLILPLILVPLGCLAVYIRLRHDGGFLWRFSSLEALKWTGFMLMWNIGIMLAGAYAIASLTGIGFGPLITAGVKLGALAVVPHAVILLVQLGMRGEVAGYILGWALTLPVSWWLFMYLFELDALEALICVGGTTILRWLSYLIYWFVYWS